MPRRKQSFTDPLSSSQHLDDLFLARLSQCESHYKTVLQHILDDAFAEKLLKRTNTERSEALLKFIMSDDEDDRISSRTLLSEDASPPISIPPFAPVKPSATNGCNAQYISPQQKDGRVARSFSVESNEGLSLSRSPLPSKAAAADELILRQITPEKVPPERIQKDDDEKNEFGIDAALTLSAATQAPTSPDFSATDELFLFIQSTAADRKKNSSLSCVSVLPNDDNEQFIAWVSQMNCFFAMTETHVDQFSDRVIASIVDLTLEGVLSEIILDHIVTSSS